MTQAKPRFRTIEEYLDYDDGTDTRYELVDGELVELPNEKQINLLIARFLFLCFVQMGIPFDRVGDKQQIAVESSTVTAREPDLTVIPEETLAAMGEGSFIARDMPAPLLVVEIVSPGKPGSANYDRDYVEKPREYAARGIAEFWQVDPSREIVTVLSLENGVYRSREFRGGDFVVSPTFPDLQLTAEQILRAGSDR
ncbi:Uma2 family endonuclease [Cyanobacteria bacterium FACHB-63]|nr:Uma2 family endonuclease [Cyanobacteria bacterium FACHB-63]